MSHLIDPIPLSFFTGLTVLALFLCIAFVFRTPHPYPGLRDWVFSAFLLGAAGVLIGLRGIIPGFASIVVSNVVGLGGLIVIRRGLGRFFDIKLSWWPDILLLGGILFTQVLFAYVLESLLLRTLFISVAHGLTLASCAQLVRAGGRVLFPEDPIHPLALVLGGVAIFHAVRVLVIGIMLANPVEDADRILFGASILIMNPGALMMYVGLISLHARRTNADLVASQSEVRVLSGLLPICCQCKKIRTEQQDWMPVEVYVRDHSQAEFSHGLCPTCAQNLYPDE